MILFGDIAKVSDVAHEVSYKTAVAGCGKTALDVSCSSIVLMGTLIQSRE